MPPNPPSGWALPIGSLERWPEDYERGRPGWPSEAVAVAGLRSSDTVLELGAGTGKLTRLLVASFERVIALEPEQAMRRLLAANCPDAEALDGAAEAIPLVDASVDGVFAAEAFHRFEGRLAVVEIARVLRPDGMLVLMWNLPAGPWEPSIAAVEQFLDDRGCPSRADVGYDPLDLNTVRYESGEWRLPFEGSPFGEFEETSVSHVQTLDRDGLVAFLASMGWIGDLPDDERTPLLEGVMSRLDRGEHRRVWETHVHTARLTD